MREGHFSGIHRSNTREKGDLQPKPNTEKKQRVIGKHVFGNLYGIEPRLLSDKKFLENAVIDSVKIAGMHLVEIKSWEISGELEKLGGGVSVIALLTESHIALHGWKEHGYATVDVYTCGEQSDPQAAFEHLRKLLKPKRFQMFYADRSDQNLIRVKE